MDIKHSGFTLIEILIVIAIIGILASIVLGNLSTARLKAQDTKRIAEVSRIQTALESYYLEYGQYPVSDLDGCGGWDIGNSTLPFISNMAAFIGQALPVDKTRTGNCRGYAYYRYNAGDYGCPVAKGAYYVLGVILDGGVSPNSPGWSCSGRNWQLEFGWAKGGFEN